MRHKATVFEQIVQQFPWKRFDHYVRKHAADDKQRGFTSREHFLALLAGSLGNHQGLRPQVAALAPNSGALRLLGGKAPPRSTLSDAMRDRPSELFMDLLQELIGQLSRTTRRALRAAVRLIDSTHLDLGRRMQHWLGLHQGKVAAKLHVVYDPSAQKPVFFEITPARINDITAAKGLLPIEAGATYVFDLGYYDFAWWAGLDAAGCTFVTRLKTNTPLREVERREVTPGGMVLSDQVGLLPARLTATRRNPFSQKGRAVTIRIDTGKVLRLFTNDLTSPAEEIAALYKERWQIELFFKWTKQNLKITRLMGTSENAIRSQIAVAFIAYVLVRLTQAAQSRTYAAALVLLIVRTHLFVRRAIAELLDPKQPPIPKPVVPTNQLLLPLCN
jgi:transposase